MHEVKMAKKSPATSDDRPMRKPRRKTARHTTPAYEDIAARAYEIYMQRGGGHGGDWNDWLTAERELSSVA
jgi:hypothetical protein